MEEAVGKLHFKAYFIVASEQEYSQHAEVLNQATTHSFESDWTDSPHIAVAEIQQNPTDFVFIFHHGLQSKPWEIVERINILDSQIATIVVTDPVTEPEAVRCIRAGATEYTHRSRFTEEFVREVISETLSEDSAAREIKPHQNSVHLLVIDDDPVAHKLYENMLLMIAPGDYAFTFIEAAEDAPAILEKQEIDAVLLDLDLPTTHGLEALVTLKKYDDDLPVIILTSTGDERQAVKAIKGGAYDYLVKGAFTPLKLNESIQQGVSECALNREFRRKELALLESERKLQQIIKFHEAVLENAPDMIFVKDEQYRIVQANPAFMKAYPEEMQDKIIGHTTVEQYNPIEADRFLFHDKMALKTGYRETEETISLPNGERRTLFTKKVRFYDPYGKPHIVGLSHDITARLESEREQTQLKEAMENTLEGVSHIDPSGRYTYLNTAYAEICGYTTDELMDTHWVKTVLPEDIPIMTEAFKEMMATGKVTREPRGIRKDKSVFHKSITMVARYNDLGSFIGYYCFMHDITPRKTTEEQLRVSKERYDLAVRGSAVGLWDWNIRTGELFWSDRLRAMLDIHDEHFMPSFEDFRSRLHPDDRNRILNALNDHIYEHEPFNIEYRLRRQDETYLWIHARGQAIWNEKGSAIRMAGSAQDISGRKADFEEMQKQKEMLELAEHTAKLGHWKVDLKDNSVFWSDQVYEIHGVRRSEYVPTLDTAINMFHPDDRQTVTDLINKSIITKRPYEFKLRIVCPNGRIRNVHSIGQPEINNKGEVIGMFGVVLDITEYQQALDKIMSSNTELERFAYVASHDLQEPLRTISNFTQLLRRKYGEILNDEAHSYMDTVVDGAKRMQSLISDLLDYARISEEAETAEPVDINATLQTVQINLNESIEASGATFEISKSLPNVSGNPIRILRIFQNLIGNAIKYRKPEESPHISISARIIESMCEFCISDKGIGLDEQYAELIFEPFKRLHGKGEYKGTGMGLAITRKIVESHGGQIHVEAKENVGTRFYFTLPLD